MLFNRTRKRSAWVIWQTDIDSGDSMIVGYMVSKSAAELFCTAANQYTESTRLSYEIVKR